MKRTRIIPYMKGLTPESIPRLLYAKVTFSTFQKRYLFQLNGLGDSGVILEKMERNLNFSAKNEALTRGITLLYAIFCLLKF